MEALNENPNIRVAGIRQMDDLALWIAYETGNPLGPTLVQNTINQTLDEVYIDGLTVEEEQIERKTNGDFTMTFSGTTITGNTTLEELNIQTYNKNKDSIATQQSQKYIRYPPFTSYINQRIKQAVIIGNVHRYKTQNSNHQLLLTSLQDMVDELRCIGYPTPFLTSAINRAKRHLPEHVRRSLDSYIENH
jgi:hypothetical protein